MSRELQEFSIMVDVYFEPAEQIEQEESLWDQILVLFIWWHSFTPLNKPRGRACAILRLNIAISIFQINFAVHGQKNCIY